MTAYYNEIDGAAAHVLESLIEAGTIANGIVPQLAAEVLRAFLETEGIAA